MNYNILKNTFNKIVKASEKIINGCEEKKITSK